MDFDSSYRFTLDCEINPKHRRIDSIRSQLLQIYCEKKSIPQDFYQKRFKDLLDEYSSLIDDPEKSNSLIQNVAENLDKETQRPFLLSNYQSILKKKLDLGKEAEEEKDKGIAGILPQGKIRKILEIAKKFRQSKSKRILNLDEKNENKDEDEDKNDDDEDDDDNDKSGKKQSSSSNLICPSNIKTQESCIVPNSTLRNQSPVRPSGLFKKKSQSNNFTKALFTRSSSSPPPKSPENSQNSRKTYSCPSSQESVQKSNTEDDDDDNDDDEMEINQKHRKSKFKRMKSEKEEEIDVPKLNAFITGLEKQLVDKIINNDIDKDEARKIIENVRKESSQTNSNNHNGVNGFKDPRKIVKNCNDEQNSKLNSLISDERLKGIDPAMIEMIQNEIINNFDEIDWSNISGLENAKQKIQQVAILPLKRPDLFTGIRSPPKGILLFGPPGTGKTMIGRCIASQAKATFLSITSSTLTSKWVGDGEKAMKTMFLVARCLKPSLIFIDEIDSLLKSRSNNEHESSRRMKTEFLSQFDGLSNDNNDGLLVIGTTNRPQELDEAVRRRFAVKLYIPLPEFDARKKMLLNNLKNEKHCLTNEQLDEISRRTDGYSGSDIKNLCSEAAMYSFQEILERLIEIDKNEIREICFDDFQKAMINIKPSFSSDDLTQFQIWNKTYGSDY